MQFPKLTPLQSRFAVSLSASLILVFIYFFLWNPHLAYAAELELTGGGEGLAKGGEDHNWARIDEDGGRAARDWQARIEEDEGRASQDWQYPGGVQDHDEHDSTAQPESEQHDHPQTPLDKREAVVVTTLGASNVPGALNINPGQTQIWIFRNTTIWGNYTDPGIGLPGEFDDSNNDDSGDQGTVYSKLKGGHVGSAQLFERQSTENRTVYISINTCLQPGWNGTSTQTGPPPQLTLYISNTTSNRTPGPNITEDTQVVLPLDEGFASYSIDATADLYMSVAAPDLPSNFSGVWNYNLAASIDGYYHSYHPAAFLHLVDTDTNSALLVTENLTQANPEDAVYQQWMNLSTPFIVFAQNIQDSSVLGVKNSLCGLQTTAQLIANPDDPGAITDAVQMGMVTRGLGNKPKEQFYIKSLNASSDYEVFLGMLGNSTRSGAGIVGGGGQVWSPVSLRTKQGECIVLTTSEEITSASDSTLIDGNCALIFNLTFCSEVAYAVPSNPYTFPSTDYLSAVYDSYAANMYQNFNYSLQQIPCNTTSSAQYSLAKNCDDCAAAYKQWLCAVTMPRCEDFSAQLPWLQPRNMAQRFLNSSSSPMFISQGDLDAPYNPMESAPGDSNARSQTYASVFASNSSRNPEIIDQTIMPGPYKEVLPCEDLCYSLVQSCPASLGFGCPSPGKGLERDYGKRTGDLTCSYLGAVYYLNDAGRSATGTSLVAMVVAGLVSLGLLIGA